VNVIRNDEDKHVCHTMKKVSFTYMFFICIYIHTHKYLCIYIHIYTSIYIYIQVYTYIYKSMHIYNYIYMCVYIYRYVCVCVCTLLLNSSHFHPSLVILSKAREPSKVEPRTGLGYWNNSKIFG
jgi:hypothetical protein